MSSSIVVAAFNEEKHIEECLKSLINQSKKPDEIILVDDGSTDKTIQIASKLPIKIIKANHIGRSAARNTGWKNAKGEIICFGEADSVFEKNWLKEILKEFEKGADTVIDRRKLFQPKTFAQNTFQANFLIRYANYKPFSAWGFKKKILQELNGFDEKLHCAEDRDLGTRLKENGYKISLAKNAVQYHKGEPKTFLEFTKRAFFFGKEKGKGFYKKYPQHAPTKKIALLTVLIGLIFLSFIHTYFFYSLILLTIVTWAVAIFKVAIVEKGIGKVKLKYLFGISILKLVNSTFYSGGVLLSRWIK